MNRAQLETFINDELRDNTVKAISPFKHRSVEFAILDYIDSISGTTEIAFTESIPFNVHYTSMQLHEVASDLVLTPNITNARPSAVTLVRLETNGINTIDISAFKIISSSDSIDNQLGVINYLMFFYDGVDYWVNIYQEAGSIPTPPDTFSWENLVNAVEAGDFIAISGSTPAGGRASTYIDGTAPFDVRVVIPADVSDVSAVVLYLTDVLTEAGEYTWSPGVSYFGGFFVGGGNEIGTTNATFVTVTSGIIAATGYIIRMINSSDDLLVQVSTNDGEDWTLIRTFSGVLSGATTIYAKVLFATSNFQQMKVEYIN